MQSLKDLGFRGPLSENEVLANHTYFRIGGPARYFAQPLDEADLEAFHHFLKTHPQPFSILGAGSNVLIPDAGLSGWVIKTDKLNRTVTATDPSIVLAGAGYAIGSFVREAARKGWGGLEWLVGIPGTVGGVVAMNGGTFLGEAKDALLSVELMDLKTGLKRRLNAGDLKFSYRANHFIQKTEVVLRAEFKFTAQDPVELQKKIQDLLKRRKEAQPVDLPCCGSVFKNPQAGEFRSAWQVVEKLGLRGFRIGNAQVSEKHANFIVNLGQAKASDVEALIQTIQTRAETELGIKLEAEVKFFGEIAF